MNSNILHQMYFNPDYPELQKNKKNSQNVHKVKKKNTTHDVKKFSERNVNTDFKQNVAIVIFYNSFLRILPYAIIQVRTKKEALKCINHFSLMLMSSTNHVKQVKYCGDNTVHFKGRSMIMFPCILVLLFMKAQIKKISVNTRTSALSSGACCTHKPM